jgi:hypothetical protein
MIGLRAIAADREIEPAAGLRILRTITMLTADTIVNVRAPRDPIVGVSSSNNST